MDGDGRVDGEEMGMDGWLDDWRDRCEMTGRRRVGEGVSVSGWEDGWVKSRVNGWMDLWVAGEWAWKDGLLGRVVGSSGG